jgi:hypothetical protein
MLFVKLLPALAGMLAFAACTPPATFNNCAVSDRRDRNVRVTVEIHNRSSRRISSFVALLTTPRALTGYTFHAAVPAFGTRRVTEWEPVEKNDSDAELRLGRASTCAILEIRYADGTMWRGPSPI